METLKDRMINYLLRDGGKRLLINWLPMNEQEHLAPASRAFAPPQTLRVQSLANNIKAALCLYMDRGEGRNGSYTADDVIFAAKYAEVAASMVDGEHVNRARIERGDYGVIDRDRIITEMIDEYGYLEAAQQTLYNMMGGILTPDSDGEKSILDE